MQTFKKLTELKLEKLKKSLNERLFISEDEISEIKKTVKLYKHADLEKSSDEEIINYLISSITIDPRIGLSILTSSLNRHDSRMICLAYSTLSLFEICDAKNIKKSLNFIKAIHINIDSVFNSNFWKTCNFKYVSNTPILKDVYGYMAELNIFDSISYETY